ncbi:efflux RND transporter periplasmic adaptor subunit [Breoghania sp. L-A4]|uniref:efflux RND transporter periplasmic adaptor subunit n=1 Tax=Breoghania sp. L-A4 TaxID=2304600 RepID=UPI000E35CD1B|nr:efflux RND transporter periplasmic adaptor subunit [Breoghania sp. L-A4]AXS38801.1 efflux RND transporter periplasmic adaptor subunit [Breoghania sp. L-A4]
MIKRFIIAIILIALVSGGLVGFNLFRDKMIGQFFANRQAPVVNISTITVKPEVWKPGIEAIGTIVARQGVDVASRAAGVVTAITFKSNQNVEKGDLLVQLDDEVEQADLIAAKANVSRDEGALKRSTQLSDRGFSSTSSLDNAKAALDASRSQMERVQAQINQKKIVAPFSGTIGIPRIDAGEYLPVGSVIATLQDLKTMKVDFSVNEQLFAQLKIGQPLAVGVTEADMAYRGKITGIDPKIDPSSRLVAVQAEFENTDGALRPGQFAFVRVELPEEEGIIALPQTAVVQSLYGTYVFVADEAKPAADAAKPAEAAGTGDADTGSEKAADDANKLILRQIFVKVGRSNEGRIEITEGLKAGEQVVSAGQNRLSAGSPVKIDNTIDPAAAAAKPGA